MSRAINFFGPSSSLMLRRFCGTTRNYWFYIYIYFFLPARHSASFVEGETRRDVFLMKFRPNKFSINLGRVRRRENRSSGSIRLCFFLATGSVLGTVFGSDCPGCGHPQSSSIALIELRACGFTIPKRFYIFLEILWS